MKLEIRNLHQDVFNVEMDENETVKALKDRIASRDDLKEKYNSELLKLLCAGKVMDDEEMLKTFPIKPDGFLVLVKQTPGKAKPPPKKKPGQGFSNQMSGFNSPFGGMSQLSNPMMLQPFQNPLSEQPHLSFPSAAQSSLQSPFQSHSLFPGAATFGSQNPPETLFGSAEDREQSLEQLVAMGFDRSEAERTLRACQYDVGSAIDRLTSGNIPPEPTLPTPSVKTSLPSSNPSALIAPQASPAVSADQSEGTELNLKELARRLRQNPEQLQTIKERLQAEYPDAAQMIELNPQGFIDLILQAADEDTPTPTNSGGASSITNQNPGTVTVSLSPQDQQAIQRMQNMGFDRDRVIEAFLACDRNEELAVNYLLS